MDTGLSKYLYFLQQKKTNHKENLRLKFAEHYSKTFTALKIFIFSFQILPSYNNDSAWLLKEILLVKTSHNLRGIIHYRIICNFSQGYQELLKDNATEHGRTINILHRFNILPEIIISIAYRSVEMWSMPWWHASTIWSYMFLIIFYLSRWLSPEEAPSVFYVSSVFLLHGVYGATLYITSWLLSDSVLAGMITVTLFIIHRWLWSYLGIYKTYLV